NPIRRNVADGGGNGAHGLDVAPRIAVSVAMGVAGLLHRRAPAGRAAGATVEGESRGSHVSRRGSTGHRARHAGGAGGVARVRHRAGGGHATLGKHIYKSPSVHGLAHGAVSFDVRTVATENDRVRVDDGDAGGGKLRKPVAAVQLAGTESGSHG